MTDNTIVQFEGRGEARKVAPTSAYEWAAEEMPEGVRYRDETYSVLRDTPFGKAVSKLLEIAQSTDTIEEFLQRAHPWFSTGSMPTSLGSISRIINGHLTWLNAGNVDTYCLEFYDDTAAEKRLVPQNHPMMDVIRSFSDSQFAGEMGRLGVQPIQTDKGLHFAVPIQIYRAARSTVLAGLEVTSQQPWGPMKQFKLPDSNIVFPSYMVTLSPETMQACWEEAKRLHETSCFDVFKE